MVEVRKDESGITVLEVSGDLDCESAEAFADEVRGAVDASRGPVLLDLQAVPFMDSTGMRCLLELLLRLRNEGRDLAMCCLNTGPKRAAKLVGLPDVLPQFGTRAEAMAALTAPSAPA